MNERSNASTAIHSNNDDDDDDDDNDNGKQEKLPSKCTNWFSKWFFFFTSFVFLLPFCLVAKVDRVRKKESERERNVGVNTHKYQFMCRERYFYVDLPGRFGTQKTVSNFQLKCAVSLRMKQPHTKENEEKKNTEWNWFAMVFTFVFLTYLVISFSHPFRLLLLLFKLKINSFYVILTIIEHSLRLNM